ncbi:MerR family transcriptional regulator [Catellatospora citrea]|uniref:MerR family transcriptional regulator n=1 Tax=Catellatospora citrea TaxID=53366 RepID=A0A8J3NYT2_9ACTN|nr:MerR family transcriptional regulator [Catellatospora citrea]RKE05715.1 DNA-binding transcriptional MerR regulator [Catellatospora citrea]GIF97076.1 MerR family transcriptional regulator [Catellatospora citrea]
MRIGELATKTGVSVRALRYYEEQHLLAPERSPSGQRRYPDAALDRVQWIQQLYAAGLPSKKIVELLPCLDTGISTSATLALLKAERERIHTQIAGLVKMQDKLDTLIAVAEQTAPRST